MPCRSRLLFIFLMYLVVGISMTILVLVVGFLSLGVCDSGIPPPSVYPLFAKRLISASVALLLPWTWSTDQHSKKKHPSFATVDP